ARSVARGRRAVIPALRARRPAKWVQVAPATVNEASTTPTKFLTMIVHCLKCPSSIDAAAGAGVLPCPVCGALIVWPACPKPGGTARNRTQAERSLIRGALRYGVMPWTMKSLIEQYQELDRFYFRAGWNIEERIPVLRFIAGHGTRA